jgi:hypothetical protein
VGTRKIIKELSSLDAEKLFEACGNEAEGNFSKKIGDILL